MVSLLKLDSFGSLVGAVLVASLATVALGQTPDEELPPEAPATETPAAPPGVPLAPGALALQIQEKTPRWEFVLGARESWNSNPLFLPELEEGSLVTGVGASLRRSLRFQHGSLALGGDGSLLHYSNASQLSTGNYTALLSGSFNPAPRLSAGFDGGFFSGYSLQSPSLVDTGLLLPQTVTHRSYAGAILSRQLSAASGLSASARYQRYSFESDVLRGGSEWFLGATFAHQFGPRRSLALGYGFRSSTGEGAGRAQDHSLALTGTAKLDPRWSASASAGLIAFQAADGSRQVTPQLSATLSRAGQHAALSFGYSRTLSQAFGLGFERLADLFSIAATRNLSRRVSARATYGWGLTRDVLGSDATSSGRRFTTNNLRADVNWTLAGALSVNGSYSFYHLEPRPPEQGFSNNEFGIAVSYAKKW